MGKILIIVESPTKIKTLKKFLAKGFLFESSVGHVRDLPAKSFGIDVDHKFEPEYEILAGKEDVIKKLKAGAKEADMVYLSPDPDREGEAIAWHIASILPKGTVYKRVTFNEFTKDAVLEALKHPRTIDMNLVNAQQARRLLDRMVGYKLSPILYKKVPHRGSKSSLSAGRVQSVALKLIVDREREIDAFKPIEYWNLGAFLQKGKERFEAHLHLLDGKKVDKNIGTEKQAKAIQAKLDKASYTVEEIQRKEKKRNPSPPFITSTLQQEAARHFGFSSTRTMQIAQTLYEEGLITYMRTDSVRASPEAITAARKVITSRFGKEYLPSQPNHYATKKSAQDAHEAIRPTDPSDSPKLASDQDKLYRLIQQRFLASQMLPAIYDTLSADIATDKDLVLRATGSVLKFPGYLAAYQEKEDEEREDAEKPLPNLREGENLKLAESFATQSFTKPPARFTEASLVKELEKVGIGRPSTYASIMQKILSRAYTTKEKGSLKPTELGKIICQMLETSFPQIMNVTFTARMEEELDRIAETDIDWRAFLKQFWHDFIPLVKKAEKEAHVPRIPINKKCPDCGAPLEKVWAGDKYFIGCSRYPDCSYTEALEDTDFRKEDFAADFNWEQPCPICQGDMKVRKSRFGYFLGCVNYPECKGVVSIPKKGEVIETNLPPCPAKGCPGHIMQRKSRFGKTFYSCSTFPDCNVIVNHLDELKEKYHNYPRTAYEKPAKGAPRGRNALLKPSEELAKIVGADPLSRGDATKKLWTYIKKHHLQDPNNKRTIVPDKVLAEVIGKKPLDMMRLATHLSRHLH